MSIPVLVLCAAVGVALPSRAAADSLWDPDEGAASNTEAAVEYRAQMKRGDEFAIKAAKLKAAAQGPILRPSRRRRRGALPRSFYTAVERAVSAYERAAKVRPDAAEPHYRAAEVLHAHILERSSNTPTIADRDVAKRALRHWHRFERLAPLDPRATNVLFRRAIVYTKLATEDDLSRAIVDYETLLARKDLAAEMVENVSTWLANLAETYMMVGRLEEAITAYGRALDYSRRPLYAYGLAVALDRDGQGELARQVMRAYSEHDRMRALRQDGIFFVPDGEQYYYYALGYDSLAEYDQAVKYYQYFLDSGAHPRYQARARANLARVKRHSKKTVRLPRGLGW